MTADQPPPPAYVRFYRAYAAAAAAGRDPRRPTGSS